MKLFAAVRLLFSAFSISPLHADLILSFQVDPTGLDTNMDTFINGTEFSPVGADGTVFTMTPTNNLTGPNRFLLSAANGLSFGGGSESSLTFDFSPDKDIQLNSSTLGGGINLNNPTFDIREGGTTLSASNPGNTAGNFASGPINLQGGTTYSFIVTNTGAAIQRQMATWDYTVIPEPS